MPDLNGKLAAFGLRTVLDLLATAGKTGELRLQTSHGSSRILVADGGIAYATTATGADTVQELDRLLMRYQPGSDDVGAGPETIELALEEQVTDVLFEVLEWESGAFEFDIRESVQGGAVHVSTVERALELVEVRRDEWKALREVIPTNDAVYTLSPRLPEGVAEATFDGLRWRLLALIGDGGSVDFIARELEVSDFRATCLLADLIEAGYVQPDAEAVDAVDDPPAPVPEVFEQLAVDGDVGATDPEPPDDDRGTQDVFEEEIDEEDFFGEPLDEPERLPDLQPRDEPVTFSADDLTQEEKDEMIRNMGKGIFPA